jgi:hypothetical protein
MNSLQTDSPCSGKRKIEQKLASLWADKQMHESQIRHIDNLAEELRDELKQLNQE